MKVAIIGGGASGLICANVLSLQTDLEITLFEKNAVLGRKLAATGNGRGNLANEKTTVANFHTNASEILEAWFSKIDERNLFNLLEKLGILLTKDYRGRYYPFSFEAKSVARLLAEQLYYNGVKVKLNTEVNHIFKEKTGFKLVCNEEGTGFYDVLILATGGLAAPQLGATDFGMKVLKNLGHKVYPTFPAIVHLKSESAHLKKLDGLKWIARLSLKGLEQTYLDEVHFAKDALSGPCAFQASIGYQKAKEKPTTVFLDLMPEVGKKELLALLLSRRALFLQSEASFLLMGLLPEKLNYVLLKETGLLNKRLRAVSSDEIESLVKQIKAFQLPVSGTREYKFAQSTIGGASLRDFDKETMASNLVENLYATGEVLDVCGDCGGYNLYFAWFSGVLVAQSIIKKLKGENK